MVAPETAWICALWLETTSRLRTGIENDAISLDRWSVVGSLAVAFVILPLTTVSCTVITPYSRRPSDTTTAAPVTVFDAAAVVDGAGFGDDFVAVGVAAGVGVTWADGTGVVGAGTLDAAGLDATGAVDESAGDALAAALPGVALSNAAAGGVFAGAVL